MDRREADYCLVSFALLNRNARDKVASTMSDWFARPLLFVIDVARSVDFYVHQLGFVQNDLATPGSCTLASPEIENSQHPVACLKATGRASIKS
jgi:hypothetical protein